VGRPTTGDDRWVARPLLAAVVSVVGAAGPILCAVAAAVGVGTALAPTHGVVEAVVRWAVVLVVCGSVFAVAERMARWAEALAALMGLGLRFPGTAPSRWAVAGRVRRLWPVIARGGDPRVTTIAADPGQAAVQLLVLAVALGAHDRKGRGHCRRVAALCDRIGAELALSVDDGDRLRWAGLVHDVGKLTVRGEVVNQAGDLSMADRRLVEGHARRGALLVAPIESWLGPWSGAVAEHHERFDGSGYPDGLVGQEISLGGRIVAVADVFDAMSSRHGYHRPMSAKTARLHLAAYAGTLFDPMVVRAFLAARPRWFATSRAPRRRGVRIGGGWAPTLAATVDRLGRAGVSAVVTVLCVVGLTATEGGSGSAATARPAHRVMEKLTPAAASRQANPDGAATTRGGDPPAASALSSGSGANALVESSGPPSTTAASGGRKQRRTTATKESSGAAGFSAGSAGAGSPPTTTGTTPPVTTTTGGHPPPRSTTTTTTTTPPPPPPVVVAPSGLRASASCQLFFSEVTLGWTASPTSTVTGYTILRGFSPDALSAIATVSGRTVTSYTDTGATVLGATYWYAVEALAPNGVATSGAVSATTPSLCVSVGAPL